MSRNTPDLGAHHDQHGRQTHADRRRPGVPAATATYRSLGEQQLSEREERFEKGRRTVGLVLAPLATIVMLLLPLGIEDQQHTLAAVLLGVVVLWITEPVPIPVGGFIGVGAIVLLGVVDRRRGARAVRLVHRLHVHRRVHPGPGDAQARPGEAVRDVRSSTLPGVGSSTFRVIIAFGADHLPAVGVRLQHRDGRDAAAHRDRHPHRHRQADAGPGRSSPRTSTRCGSGSAPR